MKTGTCHFPSYGAALRYYRPYVALDAGATFPAYVRTQELRALVDRKLNEGEIHIGKPATKPGDVLTIEDNRWHITEATP